MERYDLHILFDSDNDDAVEVILNLFSDVLPYMVDNVYVSLAVDS